MLCLNDDCLNEIFIKLELDEQLNSARVCRRFRDIITKKILQHEFCEFDTRNLLIKTLNEDNCLFLLQLICESLKCLRVVEQMRYEHGKTERYIGGPELKTYFTLNLCNLLEFECSTSLLKDEHMLVLTKNCKKLRRLRVVSKHITGEHIPNMNQLEELAMEHCRLKDTNLTHILTQMRLKSLKLINVRTDIEKILLNTPLPQTLQTLTVSGVKVFGLHLAEHLNITNLDYDSNEPVCQLLSPKSIKRIRKTTTFPRVKEDLRSFKIGMVTGFLDDLQALFANLDEQEDITFPDYIEILSPILRLVDYCKGLECVEVTSLNIYITKLDQFVSAFLKRKRSLRLVLLTNGDSPEHIASLKKWQQESQIYNAQNLLTIKIEATFDNLMYLRFGF